MMNQTKGRVLVVDDSVDTCNLIHLYLTHMGHEVMAALSPFAAEELLEQHNFDVIILDIEMPEVSGVEFASKIVKKMGDFKPAIIFFTSLNETDIIFEAMRTKPYYYLFKSSDKMKLKEVVGEALVDREIQKSGLAIDPNCTGSLGAVLGAPSVELIRIFPWGVQAKASKAYQKGELVEISSPLWSFLGVEQITFKVLEATNSDHNWSLLLNFQSLKKPKLLSIKRWIYRSLKKQKVSMDSLLM